MPGIRTFSRTRPGRSSGADAPSGTYFPIGKSLRGPVDTPAEAFSMSQWEAIYGTRTTAGTLWDDVKCHFEEGGVRVVTLRCVGPSATKGTRVLVDRAGSPLSTVAIDARDPGPDSANISVEVVAGGPANSYTINVYYPGGMEIFADLLTPAAAEAALVTSQWVRARALTDATAAPNNNPALLAPTALSAGADDLSNATVSTMAASAATLLTTDWGTGVMSMPGQAPGAVSLAMRDFCDASGRDLYVAVPLGQDKATAKATILAARNALDTGRTIETSQKEYIGSCYPGVVIIDSGVRRTITAEGYWAAKRAKSIVTNGFPASPAGEIGQSDGYVVDVERPISRADGDELDAAYISVIRVVQKTIRLYGNRSWSADTDTYYGLEARDIANFAQAELVFRVEPLIGRTNGGPGALTGKSAFLQSLEGYIRGVGSELELLGALDPAPDDSDPGWVSDVGPALNTPAVISARRAVGRLGIRPAGSVATIDLYTDIAAPTASL